MLSKIIVHKFCIAKSNVMLILCWTRAWQYNYLVVELTAATAIAAIFIHHTAATHIQTSWYVPNLLYVIVLWTIYYSNSTADSICDFRSSHQIMSLFNYILSPRLYKVYRDGSIQVNGGIYSCNQSGHCLRQTYGTTKLVYSINKLALYLLFIFVIFFNCGNLEFEETIWARWFRKMGRSSYFNGKLQRRNEIEIDIISLNGCFCSSCCCCCCSCLYFGISAITHRRWLSHFCIVVAILWPNR